MNDAWIEVYRLLVDYADGLDTRDLDRVGACFTADASAVYSGIEVGPGRAEIQDFLGRHLTSRFSSHVVGNVQVEVITEDEAKADSFVLITHVVEGGDGSVLQQRGVRYRDLLRREDGAWRIHERRHVPGWQAEVPGALL